jgi:hypothetical protein
MVLVEKSEKCDQFYFDIFVTSMEGGISYWARTTKYVNNNPNFFAVIEDYEDDGKQHTINKAVIMKGLQAFLDNKVRVRKDITKSVLYGILNKDAYDIDAEIADCIIQAGLFGEVVYG